MKFTFSAGDKPLDGFTIKRAIHRGGFGEVYYALSDAGKEVALKLLHDNMEIELRGVSQCLNLKHANLVTIFDVKTDAQNDHWIVMEYIAGETLAETISNSPNGLPKADVAGMFKQCSDGLAFLHDRGLVHRDLKPANIFSEDGVLKIGDVGLSKFISQSQRSAHTQSVGTVYYMAPEVAKGRYGKGVDIYAMGIIAFEMMTGQVPFDGESTGEILMKHLTEKPDLTSLEKPIASVIQKALEKDERDRFDSIQEFQQALQVALKGKQPVIKQHGDVDDGVHVAVRSSVKSPKQDDTFTPRKRDVTASVVTKQQADKNAKAYSSRNQPLITQQRFEDWWWVPAIIGIVLLFTKSLFASILFGGLIAGSVHCFRRSRFFVKQKMNSVKQKLGAQPGAASNPLALKPKRPRAVRKLKRSSRELTVDLLRSVAIAPVIVFLIACSIVIVSQNFFMAALSPGQIDFGHIAFFVASSTFLIWIILGMNRLFGTKDRLQLSTRLRNGIFGMMCGAALFGMGEWFMVEFPRLIFSSNEPGIISKIGRHELATTRHNRFTERIRTNSVYAETHQVAKMDQPTFTVDNQVPAADHGSSYFRSGITHYSPTLAGYIIFFGSLFAWRSWGQMGDFERRRKFRLGSVGFTIFGAYLICCIFTFPTVWAITWAATIAAAIQLASPSRLTN